MKKILIFLSFLVLHLLIPLQGVEGMKDSNLDRFYRSKKTREKILLSILKDHTLPFEKKPNKIPKIIHQIWLGSPLPERFKDLVKTWQAKHPDWIHFLWTDETVLDLENQVLFDSVKNYGMKSDILRYEILKKYGGVYVDIDYECLKPLDLIHLSGLEFYTSKMDDGYITNALIGAVPNHPIILNCMSRLKNVDPNIKDFQKIIDTTGPLLITYAILDYILADRHESNIAIFDKNFCFPMPANRRFDFWKGKMPQGELLHYKKDFGSYAIHYWATSWQK